MERSEGLVGLWPIGMMGKTFKNGKELEGELRARGAEEKLSGKGAKGGRKWAVSLGSLVRVRDVWTDKEGALRAVETRGLKPTVFCKICGSPDDGVSVSMEKYLPSFLKTTKSKSRRATRGKKETEVDQEEEEGGKWSYQVLSGREGYEVCLSQNLTKVFKEKF